MPSIEIGVGWKRGGEEVITAAMLLLLVKARLKHPEVGVLADDVGGSYYFHIERATRECIVSRAPDHD